MVEILGPVRLRLGKSREILKGGERDAQAFLSTEEKGRYEEGGFDDMTPYLVTSVLVIPSRTVIIVLLNFTITARVMTRTTPRMTRHRHVEVNRDDHQVTYK